MAPNWPGGECVLSDPHIVFDDEDDDSPKLSMSWSPSAGAPIDPSNTNFHLRNTNIGITNLSAHTYYDTTYFASWFYLRENATTKHNYAPWNSTTNLFDTEVPPTYPWLSGWAPRDTPPLGTPGAQAGLNPGLLSGNPLPPVIVSPEQLGKTGTWASGETRPGYVLPDVAPGATRSFTQTFRIERPTNTGAYASLQYRVVSVTTCLPVPTIAQPTVGDTELSGTGTTVGDVITVTDQDGNVLGTAVVQSDLTWSLTLSAPVGETVTDVTATAVDEFAFEGSADTPVLRAPSIADPVSVALSCSGDAVFTTSVTAGAPAPSIVWEQSTDGGTTWEPAEGALSPDDLSLTVAATTTHDGMRFRAVASNAVGSVTSGAATLTVSACPIEVTPIAPRVTDPSECGVEQTFETTPVTGVTYVQERIGNTMRFTASADAGYVLAPGAQSVWEFEIAAVTQCIDSPEPGSPGSVLSNTGGTGAGPLAGIGAALLAGGWLMLARRRSAG